MAQLRSVVDWALPKNKVLLLDVIDKEECVDRIFEGLMVPNTATSNAGMLGMALKSVVDVFTGGMAELLKTKWTSACATVGSIELR